MDASQRGNLLNKLADLMERDRYRIKGFKIEDSAMSSLIKFGSTFLITAK